MDGSFERVPSSNLDEEELEIIGKIINHGFIQYNIFPLELCKSTLKYSLFGLVGNDELLASFIQFIPPIEAQLVQRYSKGEVSNNQPILDILCEYSIFELPTQKNVLQLCQKAANVGLVRNPCFSMQSIVKGMGTFCKKLSSGIIESLFACTIPNAETMIECIHLP